MVERIAWIVLALIHVAPGVAALIPGAITRLYGVPEQGPAGLLLQHRSVLFAAVVIACIWAVFDTSVRPIAAVTTAVSVIGFLVIYAWHGMPAGSLRSIAWADLAALAPLAYAGWRASMS